MYMKVANYVLEESMKPLYKKMVSLAFDAGTTNSLHCLSAVARYMSIEGTYTSVSVGMKHLTESATAQYLASIMIEYVEIIVSKGGVVVEIVTDNAANMLAAMLIVVVTYPSLMTSRCWCHLLQLSIKDIIENNDVS
eukprot:PhM_4_TR13982/c2_g3_i4/m.81573